MTLIIGHRGAAASLPENTLESFRLAFEQKAGGIEFDVHTSKDGIPVLLHDATLPRTTNGSGYVSQHTVEQLQKLDAGNGFKIPTFEALLEEFKTQWLCVEIKEQSAELTHKVMGLIKKHKAENRCVVGSKYFEVSETMKKNYPQTPRFLSKREFVMLFLDHKTGANICPADPGAIASMPLEACGLAFGNKNFIDYLHERKIQAYYWTINNPIVMKELKNRGADGIITDNPGLGIKTLQTYQDSEK